MSHSVVGALCLGFAAVCLSLIGLNVLESRTQHRLARQQVGLSSPRKSDHDSTMSRELLTWCAVSIVVALVGVMASGPGGALAGAVPLVGYRARRQRNKDSRSEQIAAELAPALQLIVGQLRIGRNVISSISEVAETVPEPLGGIFKEVVNEARLGTPVEQVMRECADRENDRHLGVVASAIGLHSRHGGSLVEILETVIGTIEEEDRLRRDIKSVTADGRLSAVVLMGMPPVMLLLVSLLSPGYAAPLVNDPIGRVMAVIGLVLGAVGWKWLRTLSAPKVVA